MLMAPPPSRSKGLFSFLKRRWTSNESDQKNQPTNTQNYLGYETKWEELKGSFRCCCCCLLLLLLFEAVKWATPNQSCESRAEAKDASSSLISKIFFLRLYLLFNFFIYKNFKIMSVVYYALHRPSPSTASLLLIIIVIILFKITRIRVEGFITKQQQQKKYWWFSINLNAYVGTKLCHLHILSVININI